MNIRHAIYGTEYVCMSVLSAWKKLLWHWCMNEIFCVIYGIVITDNTIVSNPMYLKWIPISLELNILTLGIYV